MKKIEIIILSAILILAFAVRLYKIDRPIADWHSWRQADTAAVARNFIKEGFNPLIPKYDDKSSQANGLDNPQRYRFVEFPIYNSLIAAVWSVTGIDSISARLVTVFITLGSTFFLYFLVRFLSNWQTAALSAFFFATIPYNVFYSSTVLPGPFMVFSLLGLYFSFAKWMKIDRWEWGIVSILFANLAILSWPIAIFFLLPILYLAFNKYGLTFYQKPNLWIFAVLSLAPFIAWRIWMTQFPEGIPNWRFLINEGDIRFKGAFFRWIIVERLGKLILTVGGFSLFILGILKKPEHKEKLFYYVWLASSALYFTVFASGNVRHDYYQVPFIPIAAIFMAIGTKTLLALPSKYFNQYIGPAVALSLVASMFAFGFFEVRGFYWINKPQIIEAGKAADRILPKDATIIAPYSGDAAFLYQTNRHGYPIVDRPLEIFVDQGTKFLISIDVNDPGIQNLARHCKLIEISGQYVLLEMYRECIGK
ncbi:glycosyltransferase family 39 protein [Candidatus Curtissbacteria bacterium]|nr:glycosyltransferase family 39 protein [Candidatus Curtissbacteria bacterium]